MLKDILKVVSLVVLALPAAAQPAVQVAPDLQALLERGDAKGAYALGRQMPERLGEPAFDLHFGIAAIHAGKAAEGVLALERFLLQFPNHDGARLELARGYFLMGDDARAKEEFLAAQGRNPPAAAARVIADHLQALREREARHRPTVTGWVEAGGGYDSNPRAGVDSALIDLPILGEVTVGEAGLRVGDRTAFAGAGVRVTAPMGPRTIGFAAGQAEITRLREVKEFEQDAYAGSAGVQHNAGRTQWRAGAATGYQSLGGTPYRRTHGGFGDLSFVVNERNAISTGLQFGRFKYAGANAVRTADFLSGTVGWRHRVAHAARPEFEVAFTAGREENRREARQDLSRDLYGVRLAHGISPWAGWTFGVSAHFQRSDYQAPDAILLTTREDRYSAGELFAAWLPVPWLTLRVELMAAKNDSNLALYEYQRKTALVRVRYDFR